MPNLCIDRVETSAPEWSRIIVLRAENVLQTAHKVGLRTAQSTRSPLASSPVPPIEGKLRSGGVPLVLRDGRARSRRDLVSTECLRSHAGEVRTKEGVVRGYAAAAVAVVLAGVVLVGVWGAAGSVSPRWRISELVLPASAPAPIPDRWRSTTWARSSYGGTRTTASSGAMGRPPPWSEAKRGAT